MHQLINCSSHQCTLCGQPSCGMHPTWSGHVTFSSLCGVVWLARLSPLNIIPAPAIRWDDLANKTGADWAKCVATIMDSVKLRSQVMHGTGIGALIDYMKKILYTIYFWRFSLELLHCLAGLQQPIVSVRIKFPVVPVLWKGLLAWWGLAVQCTCDVF